MAAEVVGGLLTGSLALLADAAHMLTDAAGLALALVAIGFALRPATPQRTYGYLRSEVLSALANSVVLLFLTVYILYEAYERFRNPPEILGVPMLAVAVVGLAVNLVSMRLLASGSSASLNVIGLKHWQMMALVTLPQALRIVIPGIVNTSIALIKDSTLVMVVGLFDLLNIVTAGANDSAWLGAATEGLVFAGAVFWLICFTMSRLSIRFEKRLGSWAC